MAFVNATTLFSNPYCIMALVLVTTTALGLCAVLFLMFYYQSTRSHRSSLLGEIALVTGGARGIGHDIALRLGRRGAKVVVWDNDPAAVEEFEKSMSVESFSITAMVVDVSSPDSVRDAAAKVGNVTMLVNNAGVASVAKIEALTDAQILRTFRVNVLSHFYTCRAFLPAMKENNKGHIITMGSVMGCMGVKLLTDYCASKAAANNFHEALVMELDEYTGISATLVCPATTNSRMFAGAEYIPFFRTLDTDEVAAAVEYELLRTNRSRRVVFLPALFNTMPIYQALPIQLKVWLTNLTGANKALKRVKGTNTQVS